VADSIASCVEEIADPFKGVLLDAFGVFWAGGRVGPIPGAKQAMERLVASGKTVGILSNTMEIASKEIEKVKSHGLIQGKHFHFYITSGQVAQEMFQRGNLPFPTPKKRFWIFGIERSHFFLHQPFFIDSPYQQVEDLSEADFVYLLSPYLGRRGEGDPACKGRKTQATSRALGDFFHSAACCGFAFQFQSAWS